MKGNKQFLLVLLALLLCNVMLFAQTKRTITGVVKDDSGSPVPSASVSVKGTTQAVITDEKGRYSISVSKDDAVLVFTSLGFNSKSLETKNKTSFDITLIPSASDLNEVVVTALGLKREKKSLGYAQQTVKADEVIKSAPVDLAQGLIGKVAGLNISTNNGLTNGSSRMVIRGNNSLFGNNQPLIVVDGAF